MHGLRRRDDLLTDCYISTEISGDLEHDGTVAFSDVNPFPSRAPERMFFASLTERL